MKHTNEWDSYEGWKTIGRQVAQGEKAKKVEKWTGVKLFHITQTVDRYEEEEAALYHYDPRCDW